MWAAILPSLWAKLAGVLILGEVIPPSRWPGLCSVLKIFNGIAWLGGRRLSLGRDARVQRCLARADGERVVTLTVLARGDFG